MESVRVRDVIRAALEDPEPEVREAAAAALDRLEEASSGERLLACFGSEDLRTRIQAVYGLSCLHDRRAHEVLRTALEDPVVDVRAAAVRALEEFPNPSLLEPLTRRLEDPESVVRRAAIVALGASGDRRVATFVETTLDDSDPAIIRDALEALAKLGAAHLERVLPFVKHAEPTVRSAALRVLPEAASS
jgi:HEAT repeat protein